MAAFSTLFPPSLAERKAGLARKQVEQQRQRENELRERQKKRLAELTAKEQQLAAQVEIHWLANYESVAKARAELEVLREIIASIPRAPEPPALTPEEQAARDLHNRISGLETVVRERRWQVALIRRDVLSAVNLKLS